jgi:hypothetical protein
VNWIWKYERHWDSDDRKLDINLELGVLPILAVLAAVALTIWWPW